MITHPIMRVLFVTLLSVLLGLTTSQHGQAQESYLPQSYVPLQGQGFNMLSNAQGHRQQPNNIYGQYPTHSPFMRERFGTLSVPPEQLSGMIDQNEYSGSYNQDGSPIERAYAKRIIEPLQQFGYELFKSAEDDFESRRNMRASGMPDHVPAPYNPYSHGHFYNGSKSQISSNYDQEYDRGYQDAIRDQNINARRSGLPAGAVQDDFILSSGDRVEIIFRGQEDLRGLYTVNTEGLLIVEDFPPVLAAGRSFEQLREALKTHAQSRHNTDIFVSLDSVRQIDVLIVGHVEKPGRQILTVFHSALDALIEAGGVKKTGSLREIKLVRNGRSTIIDLYGLLMHGSTTMDFQLRDGDRIVVPPIGATIAISGNVNRPGIYEIRSDASHNQLGNKAAEKLSLNELLDMSGGLVSGGQNRFVKLSLTNDGRETVEEISSGYAMRMKPLFTQNDILKIAPSDEVRSGMIELTGHTRSPGLYDFSTTRNLSNLLSNDHIFGPDIYPLIGAIERWNADQLAPEYLPFPPLMVLKGRYDRKLQEGDIIHLFSRTQIQHLQRQTQHSDIVAKNNDHLGTATNLTAQDMNAITPASGTARHINAQYNEYGSSSYEDDDAYIHDPVLISFLTERFVFIRGAVRQEGAYPATDGINLKNIIAAAGGLTLEANTHKIELTSAMLPSSDHAGEIATDRISIDFTQTNPENIQIKPGDTIRVNQKFKKISDASVQIIGEVNHPGRYDLLPGDKLSNLLARAGGLTDQAYPNGTIFSRDSARRAEEVRFRNAARELKRSVAAAMSTAEEKPNHMQVAMTHELIAELNNIEAVGRITVEANPGTLAAQPALDILLEAEDKIYIPKRPLTVRVTGEVLSPAMLQFRDGKNPRDYIDEAGGYSFHADKKRAFVLYPDGSAEPLLLNIWNHNAVKIPPGSTIVVPKDPKPFDFMESAKDFSQILSNLAITGIFLDDISND